MNRKDAGEDLPGSVDEVVRLLEGRDYLPDRRLATTLYLALRMGRPIFLEGEAGVGKTEVAKSLAGSMGRGLVRLQCYEGLDVSSAVYEWNYPRQMIEIRLAEATGKTGDAGSAGSQDDHDAARDRLAAGIFSERFLIKRPLLQALEPINGRAPVLLIDELDRADEPFEAYLLEVLAEYQVSIPEIGTVRAAEPPIVVITSNRTREIHDAVKRRCFYHWVDYPDKERELAIVRRKAPGAAEQLSREVAAFVARLRRMDLYKPPGVAETIDWAAALAALDRERIDPEVVSQTLGLLLKYQDDIAGLNDQVLEQIVAEVRREDAQPEQVKQGPAA